jgi:hypothetical protein
MTPRKTFTLHEPQQAHRVLSDRVYEHCKPWLVAGHKLIVKVSPAARDSAMNARLHAMLSDVSEQIPWAGEMRDIETWKRLAVAAWLRAAKQDPVMFLPSLDLHGVDIVYAKTSKMSQRQVGELCDWLDAWGSERGVIWSEPIAQDAECVS